MSRKDYHDSDYVCPKRATRKPVTVYLKPETATQVNQAAAQIGMTRQDMMEQLCETSANRPPNTGDKQPFVLWLDPRLVETARELTQRRRSNLEDTVTYLLQDQIKLRNG